MRPSPLLLCLPGALLVARPAAAQHFTLEAGGGPCIGFNTLISDKGLPPKTRALHQVNAAFSLGLRYEHKHSLTVLAINSASLTRGFRTDNLITKRDANGGVVSVANSSSSVGNAPAHFTLGSGYTNTLHEKFKLSALAGVGYMIVRSNFSPPLTNFSISFPSGPVPEEQVDYSLNETTVRTGSFGVFVEAGASYLLSRHSAFGMALRYYHGLNTITRLASESFRYTNTRTSVSEAYDVALLNKGRYAALRVFYGYTL